MPGDKCQSFLRGSYVFAIVAPGLLARGETQDCPPSDSTFSVNGDLVVVPVPVSDQNSGLTSDDFTVLDDKIRQDIVSFSRREVSSSIGVIFDVSGCMGGTENVALMAARVLTDDASPDDESFLITFADVPRLEVEMRRDLNRIPDRLSFSGRQGATALFDAVTMGLHHLKGVPTPCKARSCHGWWRQHKPSVVRRIPVAIARSGCAGICDRDPAQCPRPGRTAQTPSARLACSRNRRTAIYDRRRLPIEGDDVERWRTDSKPALDRVQAALWCSEW